MQLVESVLNKVMEEFEQRMCTQDDLVSHQSMKMCRRTQLMRDDHVTYDNSFVFFFLEMNMIIEIYLSYLKLRIHDCYLCDSRPIDGDKQRGKTFVHHRARSLFQRYLQITSR